MTHQVDNVTLSPGSAACLCLSRSVWLSGWPCDLLPSPSSSLLSAHLLRLHFLAASLIPLSLSTHLSLLSAKLPSSSSCSVSVFVLSVLYLCSLPKSPHPLLTLHLVDTALVTVSPGASIPPLGDTR